MMAIINIQYTDETNKFVNITTDDETPVPNCTSPYPVTGHLKPHVDAWEATNTVQSEPAIDPMKAIRAERDYRIDSCTWLVERHRCQLDLLEFNTNVVTDLTNDQFNEVLQYMQELRDIPQNQPDATIDTVVWPDKPSIMQ